MSFPHMEGHVRGDSTLVCLKLFRVLLLLGALPKRLSLSLDSVPSVLYAVPRSHYSRTLTAAHLGEPRASPLMTAA